MAISIGDGHNLLLQELYSLIPDVKFMIIPMDSFQPSVQQQKKKKKLVHQKIVNNV